MSVSIDVLAAGRARQPVLSAAVWDADAVRDNLRDYVIEHLGDTDPILVVEDSGDLEPQLR